MPLFLRPLEVNPEDRVGASEWRKKTRDVVAAAEQLTTQCNTDAVSMWQPSESISDPEVSRRTCRENYMAPWRFRVEMLKGGGTVEKPPPGEGVTLWKEKLKPPSWQANLPLPLNREARAIQSNEHIQNYVRGVRLLAARMRQAEQEINEQVRALIRQRELTDRRLSEIRKGLLINEQSRKIREYRPASEKMPDKADNMLKWENDELRGLKRKMEKDMESSEILLKALNKCRDDLNFCCEERLRVVDLMNHSFDSVLLEAGRQSWINISRIHTPKVQGTASPPINPVGINPPECEMALNDAKRLLQEGKTGLEKMRKSENHAHDWQLHCNKTVGTSLSRKMQETMQLKERLSMMTGLLRGTIHRCQKYKEEMIVNQGLNKGPVCTTHQEIREKIDRPMVRVYQRHVGTQLPEAYRLTMGNQKLQHHVKKMEEDLEKLTSTRNHLNKCRRDKQTGRQVDYDVVRLRVRQSHPHVPYEQVRRLCLN